MFIVDCSINGTFKFEYLTDYDKTDQEYMIFGSDPSIHNVSTIYKVSIDLMNANPKDKCLPDHIYGEFYNMDYNVR